MGDSEVSTWEEWAEGTDEYGRRWVLEERMHPTIPKLEHRGKIMIDGDWFIMTPEEFDAWNRKS